MPLYILMSCTLCWAAKAIHSQDKTVLVPMLPMEDYGGAVQDKDGNYLTPP